MSGHRIAVAVTLLFSMVFLFKTVLVLMFSGVLANVSWNGDSTWWNVLPAVPLHCFGENGSSFS